MADVVADTGVGGLDRTPVPDYAARLRLDGRRVLVLGGGQGIGRQAAHAVAGVGGAVLVADLDEARASQVGGEVGGAWGVGDVTRRTDVARLFGEAVASLGGLDGLVDVVGLAEFGCIADIDEALWDRQHDIVLRHVFLAMQYGARAMLDGGTMVFVSSVSGQLSAANHAAYGAGKAGVLPLVRSAAEELAPAGIRVNAVVPGSVATPRSEALRAAGAIQPWQEDQDPLGLPAATADVAAVILFLASALSQHMTGQSLVLDGGRTIRHPFTGTRVRKAPA